MNSYSAEPIEDDALDIMGNDDGYEYGEKEFGEFPDRNPGLPARLTEPQLLHLQESLLQRSSSRSSSSHLL